MISDSVFPLILFLLLFNINPAAVMSSENIEENANMVKASDHIITGKMDEFSKRGIVVNNTGYRLCSGVNIFNRLNMIIPLKDLAGAEEITLFKNRGCVRKVKVLTFAQ